MAEFNNIDNDFACPFQCALTTITSGPSSCILKMQAGQCTHPVASEIDPEGLKFGALTTEQSLRAFSSCFQRQVCLVQDIDTNEQFLGMKDSNGEFFPITPPLTTFQDEDMQVLNMGLDEIRSLPEYQGPVQ